MSAGPDAERLISGWLHEEAVPRAPDRVLEAVSTAVDQTSQRPRAAFFGDTPMTFLRVAVAAIIIAGAAIGGGLIGRATVGPTPAAHPTPSPSSAASAGTLEAYRAARNALCEQAMLDNEPNAARYDRLWESGATAAQIAEGIQGIKDYTDLARALVDDLEALVPPSDLIDGHRAYLTRYRDNRTLLLYENTLLESGDMAGAQAVDVATNPIADQMGAFENQHTLSHCP